MKLALFGGSFDPVHLGHDSIVKMALSGLDIDKLIIMPTFISPFKSEFSAPPELRLKWIREIWCGLEKVEISDYEINLARPVPTIETVKYLYEKFKIEKFYLIIGADHLATLDKWHGYEELKNLVQFVIAKRNHIEIPRNLQKMDVHVDVSSSQIRHQKGLDELPSEIKDEIINFYQGLKMQERSMQERTESIVKVLDAKKAEEIQVFDMSGDDYFVKAMSSIAEGKTVTYGIHSNATVIGSHLRYKKDGIKFTCKCYDEVFDVFLPMIGEHNVYDALAAIGAGRVLGVKSSKIKKGLSEFTGTPMRQEIVAFDDIVILNDAYNANPSSMSEAIKALGQLEGKRKIAMLGDMLELGDFTEEGQRQVGRLLAEEGYSVVFTFGDAANFIAKEAKLAGLEVHRCNSHLEMANAYNDIREKGDVILVKGSRGLRMERVVEELKERE